MSPIQTIVTDIRAAIEATTYDSFRGSGVAWSFYQGRHGQFRKHNQGLYQVV